jgi:hypothetical protein
MAGAVRRRSHEPTAGVAAGAGTGRNQAEWAGWGKVGKLGEGAAQDGELVDERAASVAGREVRDERGVVP